MRPARQGLHMLHLAQILHLDIKPDNILRDGDNNFRIGDFGLAITRYAKVGHAGGPANAQPSLHLHKRARGAGIMICCSIRQIEVQPAKLSRVAGI